MKLNRPRALLLGFVVLLSLLACGQMAQPKPITNPSSVETALAGTARAFAKQTETANGFTITPSIVPTETLTSTPKISLQGTSFVVREDQSTLYIDHKVGIQLVIPAGWLATRLNEDEYYKAFTLDVVLENPVINQRLTKLQNEDAEHIRLNAIDTRPGHIVNGMISDITLILQYENSASLEEWEKNERERDSILEGYEFLGSRFDETSNGLRVMIAEISWNYTTEDKVFMRRMFFDLPSGTLTLDFQTNLEFKDTALPDFEPVVNSLTLLNP